MALQQLDQRVLGFGQIETNSCGFKNARTVLGDVTELRDAIRADGLFSPPVVWETTLKGKTHYVLLAGHRRLEALKQLREEAEKAGEEVPFEELTCSIFEGDLEGAMTISLADNVQRESLNPADAAEAVTRLVEKVGNQKKVGQMLGKSQPWVSNYVNLFRGLIPEALEALRRDEIRVNQAKKLAQILTPDKQPAAEAQQVELERLLPKPVDETDEPTEETAPAASAPRPIEPIRQRAKTHRSKREVEELRANLARALQDEPDVDVQHRTVLGTFLRWYFCEIDSDLVLFSGAPSDATAQKLAEADRPAKKVRAAEPLAPESTAPEAAEPPKKRRIKTEA